MPLEAFKKYVEEQRKINDDISPKNAPKTHLNKNKCIYMINDIKDDTGGNNARMMKIFKSYQDNIKRSETLRLEITKGIKSKQNIQEMLIKSIECISLMTDDIAFLNTNITRIKENYKTLE